MGYEVKYYFYNEIEKGEYDKENTIEGSIKVGDPYEEVDLDVLAGKVMALFARRNIFVVDVEIFEIVKKSISYKESKDGIRIKNRKFSFDDAPTIAGTSVAPVAEVVPAAEVKNLHEGSREISVVQTSTTHPTPTSSVTSMPVIRMEKYDPENPMLAKDASSRGYKFTIGNSYPIYKEKMAANRQVGILYTTVDDNGKERVLSDKFFVPITKGLSGNFIPDSDLPPSGDGLNWNGLVKEPININP